MSLALKQVENQLFQVTVFCLTDLINLRLEDANFQGKTVAEIQKMKDKHQKKIEAGNHHRCQNDVQYMCHLHFIFTPAV
jgi:lipopolysaccharide biosynthesis regulator YciM